MKEIFSNNKIYTQNNNIYYLDCNKFPKENLYICVLYINTLPSISMKETKRKTICGTFYFLSQMQYFS